MPELLIDHDRLFKELITTLFDDFLALFAPQILAAIDRDAIEFLDKELYSDLVVGDEQMVDILVRVKIAGEATCILIHIENQSTSETDFARRMFDYFTRLRARFGIPVYPIAIFSFDTPLRVEPYVYEETTFGLNVVRYEFQPIQLNRMNWWDYLGTTNPVATALMAKMQVAPEDRIHVRMECLRVFVTLKLDRKKTRIITEFMNNYLKLTREDALKLQEEIKATMPTKEQIQYKEYVDPFELLGQYRMTLRIAERQLIKKFGVVNQDVMERIEALAVHQIQDLLVEMIDFQTVEEITQWLDANPAIPE